MIRLAMTAMVVLLTGLAPALAGNTRTSTATNMSTDPWSSNSSSNSFSNSSDDGRDGRRDERVDLRGNGRWGSYRYEFHEYESDDRASCRRCGPRDDDD